jgi:hypothetical protein
MPDTDPISSEEQPRSLPPFDGRAEPDSPAPEVQAPEVQVSSQDQPDGDVPEAEIPEFIRKRSGSQDMDGAEMDATSQGHDDSSSTSRKDDGGEGHRSEPNDPSREPPIWRGDADQSHLDASNPASLEAEQEARDGSGRDESSPSAGDGSGIRPTARAINRADLQAKTNPTSRPPA